MPEWLIERGIGETRAALIDDGAIIEACIELDGTTPAGTVLPARLANIGANGRNAIAIADGGTEYLLPHGAQGSTQGQTVTIEVTRADIPGSESWKRPLARVTRRQPCASKSLEKQLGASVVALPAPSDPLEAWSDLIDEARTGIVRFAGGELRISATPAMTLIDVDGFLLPDDLAVLGAAEAAKAIRRLDIGGSIGIDLPTSGNRAARQSAAAAIDAVLRQPFERTAVNGFGFVQIVRPRRRASLVELAQDRAAFEARALLRRAPFEQPGPKRLVAQPTVIAVLDARRDWLDTLSRQVGGTIGLRADAAIPISGGYAEPA